MPPARGLARGMGFLSDRRIVLVLAGAAVALAAGLLIAGLLLWGHRDEKAAAPPASRGGLVIDSAAPEDVRMDPAKPLRCFVSGQFVGELTLAACAIRNGVATDALDVGLDANGALAAAEQAGADLTPLPPLHDGSAPQTEAEPTATGLQPSTTSAGLATSPASCWRYIDTQWRRLPTDLSLGGCVQALFSGRCERPGGATYGRWGQQTLRLVPGRVEISADNHSFRALAEQSASCAIGSVG